MSDFIPPLISSSPPPIPDFDDEDDDVEFGMDYNIGDLDLPETIISENDVHSKVKKNKLLEIDGRRLEINGTVANNWKCEEQDSTSQDSGLCMASQSSEGMSPLPQSDDEDKQNDTSDNVLNIKPSVTVMFNVNESRANVEYKDDEFKTNKENGVLVNDTGQGDDKSVKLEESEFSSDIIGNNEKNDGFSNEDYDSDNEFVWSCNTNGENNLFQNLDSYQVNGINSINGSKENSDNDGGVINERLFGEISVDESSKNDGLPLNNIPVVEISNQFMGSSANDGVINENSISNDLSSNSTDNNVCDNSVNESVIEMNLVRSEVLNVEQSVITECYNENTNDDFDDDDFGNFASITIPENCDPLSSDGNSFYPFSTSVGFSSKCDIPDVKPTDNELPEHISASVSKDEIDSHTLESFETDGSASDKPFSELNEESSSKVSEKDSNSGNDINKVEDDDFDDFSDFTQSADFSTPVCHQEPEVFRYDQPSSSSISQQDSFEQLFPKVDETLDSDACIQKLEHGPVWKHLCPLENSPALTFQWSNSRAHNRLLTSLSIDSRNILFGPHWNSNIPRFAANLGSNPLQPVKATEAPLTDSSSPVPLSLDDAATVPDAHFDWVGSGLTNPLDYVAGKTNSDGLEQLNVSCNTPTSTIVNRKVLSIEAESIISLLPDLSFMRKTYIEFLTNKD